jgi:hypothetical protein
MADRAALLDRIVGTNHQGRLVTIPLTMRALDAR